MGVNFRQPIAVQNGRGNFGSEMFVCYGFGVSSGGEEVVRIPECFMRIGFWRFFIFAC